MHPYEENALFLLILTVFLVRVHFFYSFLLFFRFQKCKKSVPLRGKCTFFKTNFDCFPRKGTLSFTLFYYFSDFKSVKKVHPYEENALILLILTVFLVRVHFFYFFFLFLRFQKSKKSVPLRGKCAFFTNFDCFPRKGTLFLLFFLFFRFQKCKKSVPLRGKCTFFY